MTIATENALFNWRVSVITAHAREIESAAHLFDGLTLYDTALDKLDLRLSAKQLREAADRLENVERRLKGSETAFPDFQQAAE